MPIDEWVVLIWSMSGKNMWPVLGEHGLAVGYFLQ